MKSSGEGESWAMNELSGKVFGDRRLDARGIKLMEAFFNASDKSIAGAQANWKETCAAYRFFDNNKVSHAQILKSHVRASFQRAADHDVVLCIHDSSSLNFSGLLATTDLGEIGDSRNNPNAKGLIFHSSYLVTPEKVPLGIVYQDIWARKTSAYKKSQDRCKTSVERKESFKWLKAMCEVSKDAKTVKNTCFVHVMDREADMYSLFSEAKDLEEHFLIRARHNRRVAKKSRGSNDGFNIFDTLMDEKPSAIRTLEIPTKEGYAATRPADVEIRFKQVEVTAPRAKAMTDHHFKHERVTLTFISVREINNETEYDSIDWSLLTNVAITNVDQVLLCLDYYCCRWQIEIFHRILKTGFRVEACRLESREKICSFVAMIGICAWRQHWLTLATRQDPKQSPDTIFSDVEQQILVTKVLKTKPRRKLTLGDYMILLARLGGFLNRKSDGMPGPEVLWRGWRKLHIAVDVLESLLPKESRTYV